MCNSDQEWLPEKNRHVGAEDDGDTDSQGAERVGAYSQVDEDQDDERQDAGEGQHDQGTVENGHMTPDHSQACKNIWKVQDNHFDRDLPPFLGQWKFNVEGREPIDFSRHLFPADLIDDIVKNTNLYAPQKGKENLAVTGEEMQTFLGINMIMGYIRYPRAHMYWSSEDGLRLGMIANAMSVNRYEQILCSYKACVPLCPGCFANFHTS